MSRSRSYRDAERPASPPKRRGVVVQRAAPVEDPDTEAQRAQRETGKLLALQIGEEARERRDEQQQWRFARVVFELLAGLFRP